MKKILILFFIVFLCVGCSNSRNDNIPESESELDKIYYIEDFPKIKEDSDSLVLELKNSGQFDDLKYIDFEKHSSYDDPEVRYSVNYVTNCSNLVLYYDEDFNYDNISLSKQLICDDEEFFSDLFWSNQILAITYLKRYDINEKDFPGLLYDSYTDYVNVIAGISDDNFAYTNNGLTIYHNLKIHSFYISGIKTK